MSRKNNLSIYIEHLKTFSLLNELKINILFTTLMHPVSDKSDLVVGVEQTDVMSLNPTIHTNTRAHSSELRGLHMRIYSSKKTHGLLL